MLLVKSKELNKQLRDPGSCLSGEKSAYEKAGKPSRTGSLYEKKKCQACKGYLQYPAYPDPADPGEYYKLPFR